MRVKVEHGDSREVLKTLADNSVASIVTDPPYSLVSIQKRFGKPGSAAVKLKRIDGQGGSPYARGAKGFMGKQWDNGDTAFDPEFWAEALRVLKPGGHVLAFGGSRTYHRLVCAIEDAGFEVRDTIGWLFGSGFPKSHNVAKGIDRANGDERPVLSEGAPVKRMIPGADQNKAGWEKNNGREFTPTVTAAASAASAAWEGWGTALKPAWEILCVAQKPYPDQQQTDMIGSTLCRLEHQVWSLLSAKVAAENFKLSRSEFDAACASAPWSAGDRSNTRAALSAQMDTSQCVKAILSSLNTVLSWRECLAESSQLANTSTIETESSTTIDLKIWKSCLSRITPASIILAHKSGAWSSANAGSAERYLSASASRWSAIRELSALESALDSDATNYPDAGARKPNLELICVGRKPLIGTVAQNVLEHGTGALNIDATRVGLSDGDDPRLGGKGDWSSDKMAKNVYEGGYAGIRTGSSPLGRWPANVVHDGSDEVVDAFPQTTSGKPGVSRASGSDTGGNSSAALGSESRPAGTQMGGFGDSGNASRFFYSSKADADDRLGSKHPTVKPVDLMRWLVRLITPPGGLVLDPFAGSGTTGMACLAEGFDCLLIEREAEYVADIRRRLAHVRGDDTPLFADGDRA